MASILADIGTAIGAEIRSLLSRLSDAEDKNTTQDTSILNLSTRLTSAENEIVTLGGQVPPPTGDLTIEAVQWTNLTEINLSGEKAQNASFDPPPVGLGVEVEVLTSWTNGGKNAQVGEIYEIVLVQDTGGMKLTGNGQSLFASANQIANQVRALHPSDGSVRKPYLWEVKQGVIDQDKLKLGIIKGGSDASTAVQQIFDSPLVIGTKVVVKVERSDTNSGSVAFKHVKLDGNTRGGDVHIPRDPGYVEYEVTDSDMHGIRFGTNFGARELSSISVFQGEVSGGTVQANGNGGLEKISGENGYNAGASSTNFIEGNSNGYVQFQIAQSPLRVGLTYADVDFENVEPFRLVLNFNGSAFVANVQALQAGSVAVGDYFRIRHYAVDNTIRFQKRENVYSFTTLDYANLEQNSPVPGDTNHIFEEADRPYVRGLNDEGDFTQGTIYRMYESSTSILRGRIYTLDGTDLGFSNAGTKWEVVELLGTDYVTFHTHSELTNGNNLYVDTSLFSTGSRLNDVLLAR